MTDAERFRKLGTESGGVVAIEPRLGREGVAETPRETAGGPEGGLAEFRLLVRC